MVSRRRAVLVRHRPDVNPVNEFTWWRNLAEARAAMHDRDPCSEHCVGIHTIVWAEKRPTLISQESPVNSEQK
jgi:hypothetical protein